MTKAKRKPNDKARMRNRPAPTTRWPMPGSGAPADFSAFAIRPFFVVRSLSFALLLPALILGGCLSDRTRESSPAGALSYPVARRTNTVDDYHGVKVPDPYRWLEDDNAPETRAWVEVENQVTAEYFRQIPELPAISARLTRLWNYERYGVPFKEGNRYFFTRNDGLQNQGVLYTLKSLD